MNKKSKEKEQTKTTTTNIKYKGEVSIKVKKGNKVLSSYKSHNDGQEKLFKFLADALAGSFTTDNRPCKLKLFKKAETGDDPTSPIFSTGTSMSNYIMYNTIPVPKEFSEDGKIGYSITYHFTIPSAYIETGNTAIYKLAIYPEVSSNIETDMCATFLFTNDSGTAWEPQQINSISGNIVLFIDWTMTIGNI